MEQHRFDRWTKRFARTPSSRRAALRFGVAALAAAPIRSGAAAGPTPERGGTGCKPAGRRCRKKGDCCTLRCKHGKCKPQAIGGPCATAADCVDLRADCCDGVCRDLASDESNCGQCGLDCASGEACSRDGCCITIGRPCLKTDDRCCNASFCKTDDIGIAGKCCGVSNVSSCDADADCCSDDCDTGLGICR
jgi:hypothetical protein